MKQTEIKIIERKGYSVHKAILEVRGEDTRADRIIVHGPKGCTIELKADDVMDALYSFVVDAPARGRNNGEKDGL